MNIVRLIGQTGESAIDIYLNIVLHLMYNSISIECIVNNYMLSGLHYSENQI